MIIAILVRLSHTRSYSLPYVSIRVPFLEKLAGRKFTLEVITGFLGRGSN